MSKNSKVREGAIVQSPTQQGNRSFIPDNSITENKLQDQSVTKSKLVHSALHDDVLAASADYTVINNDSYETILVTTAASDRTITLPTASANTGRRITIKKVDSGTGHVIVDGAGAETIDGVATFYLTAQYNFVELVCDGTEWHIINLDVDDYEEIEITDDTETVTANVAVDVNGSTMTVPPGTHWLEFDGVVSLADNAGVSNNIAGKVQITDSLDNLVGERAFNHTDVPANEAVSWPIFFRERVTITAPTDYKLRVVCSDSVATGVARVSDEEVTTGLTGADSATYFKRERVK